MTAGAADHLRAFPVGRNEPCPCGSGKRFKDCHGRLSNAAASPDNKASGRAELERGNRDAAVASARRAIAVDPQDHEAWNLLGIAIEVTDPHAALAAWQRASALKPGDPEAHFRIGDFERRRGRHEAAIAAYGTARGTGSRHPVLLNNLGLSLQALGRLDEAAQAFSEAAALAPTLAQAHANLGDVLRERHRFADAIAAYSHALALEPGLARLWVNLGACRHRVGMFDAAREAFERALAIDPDAADAQINLAASLTAEARYAEALPLLEGNSADAQARATLLYVKQHTCAWDGLDAAIAQQREVLGRDDAPVISPHSLLALPFSPAELLTAARHWAAKRIRAPAALTEATTERFGGRFRIGYVGSDFRAHALASLLSGVIEAHDRSQFEVFGYSFGPDDRSEARARFEHAFDRFVDVRTENVEATVRRIRHDRIAVLFDTAGYVLNARSEIFAARPAPIQINGIGFPGTLGAPWYDYILGDSHVIPRGAEADFAERILRLPHCYLPGDSRRTIAALPSRAQCGLPRHGFVFCCFNASYKILPEIFSVWMRLLREVPESVLWLLDTHPTATANLRREASRRGVDADRLVFAPRVPLPQHLARHAVADVFLDTFPCNAHTTANDALFAGLPLITCAGNTFASRVSASQLHAIGLSELVTESLGEYASLALELVHDRSRLDNYRGRLVADRDASPLFDSVGYARDLEALLQAALESSRSGGTGM